MKRIIYAVSIMVVVCSAIAYAAQDFTFNLGDFTISSAPNDPNDYTLAEKRLYFLTENPVPEELSDPNDMDSSMIPAMTEKEWFILRCRNAVKQYMAREINRGRNRIEAALKMKPDQVFTD